MEFSDSIKLKYMTISIIEEISNKQWNGILKTYHPDINYEYQEAFEIFFLYKKIYEEFFIKKQMQITFNVKEKILLLNLYKIKSI